MYVCVLSLAGNCQNNPVLFLNLAKSILLNKSMQRLFFVLAPRWWNELPRAVETADSLTVLKCKLKTYLFVQRLSEH